MKKIMHRVLILVFLLSANGISIAEGVLALPRKASLKVGKLQKLIQQMKFSKAADRILSFQEQGGDFEKLAFKLANRLQAWETPHLRALLKEFADRQEWENALLVASAWESLLDRVWKDYPNYSDAFKLNAQSAVGLVYLEQGNQKAAEQILESLTHSVRTLAFVGCGLNKEFLLHFQTAWTPPKSLRTLMPTYTDRAIRAEVQGKVRMIGVVEADGKLSDAKLLSGLGYGLDKQSLSVLEQWTFEPALFEHVPVRCLAILETTFTLR